MQSGGPSGSPFFLGGDVPQITADQQNAGGSGEWQSGLDTELRLGNFFEFPASYLGGQA